MMKSSDREVERWRWKGYDTEKHNECATRQTQGLLNLKRVNKTFDITIYNEVCECVCAVRV